MRTLVVYYSHDGSTEQVANALAETAGSDLRKLEDSSPRQGMAGPGLAALLHVSAKLEHPNFDVADYDTVVILGPIWAGNPTPAINTFLRNAHLDGKRVLLVTVSAGPDNAKAAARLETMARDRGGLVVGVRQIHGKLPLAPERRRTARPGRDQSRPPTAPITSATDEELRDAGIALAEELKHMTDSLTEE